MNRDNIFGVRFSTARHIFNQKLSAQIQADEEAVLSLTNGSYMLLEDIDEEEEQRQADLSKKTLAELEEQFQVTRG